MIIISNKRLLSIIIKVTRIARGVPAGGELEYADITTLANAIEGRVEF